MRFEILSGSTLVGYSDLEQGDPPMGVAFGRFFPLPAYASIRALVVSLRDSSFESLPLSVRVVGGHLLQPEGGVAIRDFSAEHGDEAIEVEVFGIAYPQYEELLPEHVAAYGRTFKPTT
jgi:hypothetical protein